MLVLAVTSTSLLTWHFVTGTPAPSRNTTIEPGWSQFCTDYLYQDGTTPVDHLGHGQPNVVGTAGQDWGAFLNAQLAASRSYCFEPGTYLFSTPIIANVAGGSNDVVYPSIIGPAVGAGSGTEIAGTSAVVFQASNSFPSGEFLLAYLPDVNTHEIKGAAIQNLEIMCKSPDTTARGAGVNIVNARQFNIANISVDFCVTPNPTTTTVSGVSNVASFQVSQVGSPGGFDYITNISVSKAAQDGFWLNSAESTFSGLRSLGTTRYGFSLGAFNMVLLGCMVDSGGNGSLSPQLTLVGSSDTKIVGFNSFAGPVTGGPTVWIQDGTPTTGHPTFVGGKFWGPQQAGLGDDLGSIILLSGHAYADFEGVELIATSSTYHFIRAQSSPSFVGKATFVGGAMFNTTNLATNFPISNAGTGIINTIGIQNWNPVSKLTNFVASSQFAPWGTTATVVASTDYIINGVPMFVTSTGGTGVSITVKDALGNTVTGLSGLATITAQNIPVGYKINFGGFSVAPTVTVFGN